MTGNCKFCEFFNIDGDWPVEPNVWLGQCRRRAPTGKLVNNRPSFPSTLSNEWCGEYKPSEVLE